MTEDKQVQAESDYRAGMKYKDIAAKHGVSINTVKSWKTRNGWSRGAPAHKQGAHKVQKGASKPKEGAHTRARVPKVVAESDAPEKQKLFAMYYIQRWNATWAYMQAYGVSWAVANVNGPRLLVNARVAAMIDALKAEQAAELHLTQMDVLAEAARQMGANLGDYIDFGSVDEPMTDDRGRKVIDPKTGKQRTKRVSRVSLRNKGEVDTSLIKSVHIGRDGVVVELNDKQKAMDMLLKNLPEQVITTNDDTDGFMSALGNAADGAWGDDDASD